MSWQTAKLETITDDSGMAQVRRHFGVSAFGVNAWTAREDGATLIQEHAEEAGEGQEELYVVLSGAATFTLDGEQVNAPSGTVVFVPPAVRRQATGVAGTTILAVGATPGEPYRPTGWEIGAHALPRMGAGDYAGAKEILVRGLAEFPESSLMLYNLACAEARLGEREAAIEHLARAVSLDARFGDYAKTDEDLESIRDAAGLA